MDTIKHLCQKVFEKLTFCSLYIENLVVARTNLIRRKTFDKNDKMLQIRLTRNTFDKIDKKYI